MKNRDQLSGLLHRLALVIFLVALVIAASGGLWFSIGEFEFSLTGATRPLMIALVFYTCAVSLSSNRSAFVKHTATTVRFFLRDVFSRSNAMTLRRSISLLCIATLLVLCGMRLRGYLLTARAEALERQGNNLEAAALYERVAIGSFGSSRDCLSKAAYCLYRAGEFERAALLVESRFSSPSRMPRTAIKAYMHCLFNLGRYADAAEAGRVAISKFSSLAEEAEGIISSSSRLEKLTTLRPLQTVEVEVALKSEGTVQLYGSWNGRGVYSQAEGWMDPIPMKLHNSGRSASVTIQLEPSRELPYGLAALVIDPLGRVSEYHVGNCYVSLDGGASVKLQPLRSPLAPSLAKDRKSTSDGRQRVLAIWPDCGSWQILKMYAKAGRLPNIERVIQRSRSWEMISTNPPFTATAYLAMITLGDRDRDDEVGVLQATMMQLNGLPFLDSVIPDGLVGSSSTERSLFDSLGQAGISWSSLVFDDAHLETADDHTGIVFNQPLYAQNSVQTDFERLSQAADERVRWYLEHSNEKAILASSTWDQGGPDFMLVRFPGVDLASHRFYSEFEEHPEEGPLLQVYEHLDALVGYLREALDEDDVLIFLTDHGIQDTLAHHRSCFLFLEDPKLPGRQYHGTVPIRTFSSFVLSRFGIEEGADRLGAELRELLYAPK
jgi:hypothetical protein